MTIYRTKAGPIIHHGDCLAAMRGMPAGSVDAIVTDPPYGLGFMGKAWDELPPGLEWAKQCLRVLKPGGHLLAFGGTRTWHRLAVAVEDAGFEIRDSIAWLYGSGFPKSLDVSKALDKMDATEARRSRALRFTEWMRSTGITAQQIDQATGTNMGGHYLTAASQPAIATLAHLELLRPLLPTVPQWVEELARQRTVESQNYAAREVVSEGASGVGTTTVSALGNGLNVNFAPRPVTAPATPDAQRWQGWGTALKPAFEPLVWARKPFSMVPLDSEANRLHHLLGGLIWLSLSPAKRAELSSQSSQAGLPEEWCVSALAAAVVDTSPAASGTTDTFSSRVLASTSLSIATSWSSVLGALSDPTRTSTTSTRSSTTTGLRTLNSLLGPLTSQTTTPACDCLTHGPRSSASNAANSSPVEWWSWLHILSASVPETAIEGIALAAASALAHLADDLSGGQEAGSSAPQPATTGAAANSSPAFEPIVVARKPLVGTVAANVLAHGTGALNIDATRIQPDGGSSPSRGGSGRVGEASANRRYTEQGGTNFAPLPGPRGGSPAGRWPANVVLDADQAAALDEGRPASPNGHGDSGGASRFFYVAKAPKRERPVVIDAAGKTHSHPTVKPLSLMRWLVRLVTPPGGLVLDPFAGSGATIEAAMMEGVSVVGVERGGPPGTPESHYLAMIGQRIARASVAVPRRGA